MVYRHQAWATLEETIVGEVLLPGSPEYELARKPAMARFQNIRPSAIVKCRTATDVSEVVTLARRLDEIVAVRGGGHCFAGRSSTTGVLVDVSELRGVSVTGEVAEIGAGTRLGEVYRALGEHGRTIPAGCGPDVGVAGLTLGGGLGILGRMHGFTCDSLIGAEVVLANGDVVQCDDRQHQDLFWALRGAGGGNFGVVTSLRFRTIAAPELTGFHLVWPGRSAATVLAAWQRWAPTAPTELAASLLITASGDPAAPPTVNVFGAMAGTDSVTAELIGELTDRVEASPAAAERHHASCQEVKRYLAELFPEPDGPTAAPDHNYSKSGFFRRPLPPEAVAALVDQFAADRVPGQSRELDFMPLGGGYNRPAAESTAFAHRDELFLIKHAVTVAGGGGSDDARDWLNRSWTIARPWGTGGVYPNFPDPELPDWPRAYHGDNYARLRAIKRQYDPEGFFRFHQSIGSEV